MKGRVSGRGEPPLHPEPIPSQGLPQPKRLPRSLPEAGGSSSTSAAAGARTHGRICPGFSVTPWQERGQMLYVSAVAGGPELRKGPAHEVLQRLARWNTPPQGPDGTSVTVVFRLPGSLVRPAFSGMKAAKVSRKPDVMVDVSVPEEQVKAPDIGWLMESIRSAIRLAKPKFEKAGVAFPEAEYLATVERMEKELAH